MSDHARIVKVNIEEEMKSAYIDYSMSVIVSRALPDVRDGLKPVHRRVLFGMSELGVLSNRPFKKSARIVGEVLGKYHPHGDTSVYDAMVRMAQDWSLRYPLVDGQGNFGSIDGDSPAAMRYTEAKLKRIAEETLSDIEKETVDFQPNFDDTLQEPTVLPTRIPTLLVNGAAGIAVGMATNMPPHNLSEAVDAIVAYIDDPEITTEGLMHHIKGPDFPTGGIIYGEQGIREAYETGRGRIVVRAKTEVELTHSGRECIVITEIPYMVNKADMIRKIADLINDKKLEGISYINDESDRAGMRIVIILKKEMPANIVLNRLYKQTQLQTSFNVNNIALVKGRPRTLTLKEIIGNFVSHRHDIVVRRTKYDLDQAEKRAHILEGLIIASDNIDEVIAIIRSSQNTDIARERLMERFGLTDIQARAIVDMRLRQLTGLEQDKLHAEYEELKRLIDHLNQVLADERLQMQIIKDELLEVKDKYGDKRRTQIVPAAGEFNPEDFYADDEMVITISHMGYIKRTPLTEFRRQNRGGTGKRGSTTREEDFIEHMYVATMHNTMLFFTSKGKCYWQKVYDLPEGTRNSKGRAIQNVINIEPDDSVRAFINVKTLDDSDYINNNYIVLCTCKGVIKKTSLEAYSRPRVNGINAITVREGDELLEARMTNGSHEIMLAVRSGRAVRFKESTVRPMGRTASGVRGITLSGDDDVVVGMITVENEAADVLVVSENGFGKRSAISDYRLTNRGGKGVKTINITDKTGKLIALKDVSDQYDLLIITQNGNILRTPVNELRVMGRATQGVKLIDIKENDSIASVAYVEVSEDDNETDNEIGEESAESAE
ncbi:MAG: DNA gyrase subunit A [Bacteroidales bacterium]|mgnify:FL=1|jgi:DNA gyrase subunit A|nr:DNA gyrase subunit A [Bacteroidales bacterium]HHU98976.1 DNA gyrase subunit A [Bacteroidales bacterium]HPH75126.1 DNA gyrase subunit A [Bacteroidales bacterium]HPK85326.1 DNA gyrase subunit A [Bacteroidales bacterium]HQL46856.1 DNA gyrase subunit A [Bacteroidales bacterium]